MAAALTPITELSTYDATVRCLTEALYEEAPIREAGDVGKFYDFFLEAKLAIRPYFVDVESLRQLVWDKVRTQDTLLDMIMKMSSSFQMRVQMTTQCNWESLVAILAGTMGDRTVADSSISDKDFREKASTSEELKSIFQQDPWLVFVFFLCNNFNILNPMKVRSDAAKNSN
jgi:hypothetical protein